MMFQFHKPTAAEVERFLAAQRDLPFTYPPVSPDWLAAPAGYHLNHYRSRLGSGELTFTRARAALAAWTMFDLGWVVALPAGTAQKPGEVVAVAARTLGCWILNASRIINTIDDTVGNITRHGFAYGTLPGHMETGEERFLIEWDRSSHEVWYEIRSFSRPRHWTARAGAPFARYCQRRFTLDSATAMERAVQDRL